MPSRKNRKMNVIVFGTGQIFREFKTYIYDNYYIDVKEYISGDEVVHNIDSIDSLSVKYEDTHRFISNTMRPANQNLINSRRIKQ